MNPVSTGGIKIRRSNSRYKLWKKKNDLKKSRNKIKRKGKKYNEGKKYSKINTMPYKVFTVPTVFSIINNPEETICFFNGIIYIIEKLRGNRPYIKKNNMRYFFRIDMANVTQITGDALMYLLTVIRNTRGKKDLPVSWTGNFPEKKELSDFLKDSGFLDYMRTDKRNLINTNEKIQIRTGKKYVYTKNTEKDIRKEVVDFTVEKLKKDKKETKFLFNILTEVITNIEHAYNPQDTSLLFEPSWYIMVENDGDRIKYTFMDNGLGIPTTVRKKPMEEFFKKLNIDKEYKYIKTALEGTYKRTETGRLERSTGLPDLYEKVKNGKIANLVIVSNYAYYSEDVSKDMKEYLTGTVIYWEIKKESVENDN